MQKALLGKTGMEISRVFYGGVVSMDDGQKCSDEYVEYAIKKGVNYFDIAPSYGDAQEKLGNSLIPHRKNIYLACKTACRDGEGARREIEGSLKMLHTDYIDNYQLHSLLTLDDVEEVFSKGGAFEPILRAKEQGLFKHLGITCHSEEAAIKALEQYDFETVLFPVNWGMYKSKGFGKRVVSACEQKGIGLLGMKSLIYSAWDSDEEQKNSEYPKSWCKPIDKTRVDFRVAALKYAYSLGCVALVPPGNFECFSFAVEHADEIAKPITDAELAMLDAEVDNVKNKCFL